MLWFAGLILVEALLVACSYGLERLPWWPTEDSVPLWVCCTALFLALAIYGVVGMPLFLAGGPGVYAFALFAAPPAIAYGRLVAQAFAHGGSNMIYGLDTGQTVPSDYSKARTLAKQGQTVAAVRQYRRYFDDAPSSPQPLFEAVELLIKTKRYSDAAGLLREIARLFEKDEAIWARAMFRHAEMSATSRNDKKTAERLLQEVIRRTPRSADGRLAHERLARLTNAPPPPNA